MINIDIESFDESSQFKILSTGVFFTKGKDDSARFNVMLDDAFRFELVLKFLKDKDNGDKSELRLVGNKENQSLVLTCINFKNSGTGTTTPLEIATYQGKSVMLHFWSYRMSEKATRKIEYTFYQEE